MTRTSTVTLVRGFGRTCGFRENIVNHGSHRVVSLVFGPDKRKTLRMQTFDQPVEKKGEIEILELYEIYLHCYIVVANNINGQRTAQLSKVVSMDKTKAHLEEVQSTIKFHEVRNLPAYSPALTPAFELLSTTKVPRLNQQLNLPYYIR